MTEAWLEAIEESCKDDSIEQALGEFHGEKRGGQSEAQDAFAQRGVGIGPKRVAFDVDPGMFSQKMGQDRRADGFAQHAQIEGARAGDHLEGFVGVEEGAFDVKDIPKEGFIPAIGDGTSGEVGGVDGILFGDEHALIASDDDAGSGGAAAGDVLGVTMDEEIGPLGGLLTAQGLSEKGRADSGVEDDG